MVKDKLPATPAIRMLRENEVEFKAHIYKYEEKGGTGSAARQFLVDENVVIKTLVMEDDTKAPFIVLMHGDREVSTKALARTMGVKSVAPCSSQVANKHTGYVVGGISPFGTKKRLKVYVEVSILDLPKIFINAGKRGLLVEIATEDVAKLLDPIPISVAR
jgi:Cys-tRNA(Pro) deacylase